MLPLVLAPARATRPDPARLYPAALQRRARRLRLLRRGVLGVAAAVVLGPLLAFAVGYLAFSVPNPDHAVNNQVALVSFADGSQLTRLVPEEGNRIKVPIDEVPLHVRHAVLAAEDRTFYSNPGFDLTGIARAAWNQLHGGDGRRFDDHPAVRQARPSSATSRRSGASTRRSSSRSRSPRSARKDEILADYLNTIYFGRGAYGIQSAAQAYFGKPVQDLTPSEGALLAGLIQSPSRWDPAVRPERAVERWNFVLDGMVAQGWLSPADRAAAQFPPTGVRTLAPPAACPPTAAATSSAPSLAELEELGITEQDIGQEGLRITTTIDPAPSAAGGRRRPRGAGRAAGEPAQRRGGDRPEDRRRARLLRRRQRPRPGLRAGAQARRLDVQAVRRARRADAGPTGRARRGLRRRARCPACATPTAPTATSATSSRR